MTEESKKTEEKDSADKTKGKKAKVDITAMFSPRYRSIILTFIMDVGFVVGAFWLARFSMFYSDRVSFPTNYLEFEIPLMLIMCMVPISMLALFDSYNVVWKYAGRVEFLKFIAAYLVSFLILLIVKAIVNVAFNVQVWTTQIVIFIIYALVCTGILRF